MISPFLFSSFFFFSLFRSSKSGTISNAFDALCYLFRYYYSVESSRHNRKNYLVRASAKLEIIDEMPGVSFGAKINPIA